MDKLGMAVKISRILHAGYIFECEGDAIAFDPIFENPFSQNCHAFPNVEFDSGKIRDLKFSAVFISHYHDDHCSLESLDLLDRNTPIYLYCIFDELSDLLKELGFREVHSLQLDQSVHVGALEVITRKALDEDVDSLFQIKAGGLNILNVVDSWIDESTLELLQNDNPWDLILWPFQTMREIEVIAPSRARPAPSRLPEEWISQLKILTPRFLVPSSCQFIQEDWSWQRKAFFPVSYERFQIEINEALPFCGVLRMNPGTSYLLEKDSLQTCEPLIWIQPVGAQNLDYDYDPLVEVPSTAEVSRQFPQLLKEESARIFEYCRIGLLEKFRSMDPPEDFYFQKPRLWQLCIYDHKGEAENFFYRLNGNQISLETATQESTSWLTEVPEAKFHAALELGETLTSMYLRINDRIFSDEIEKEIHEADIVEDPLIRCLFNGNFAAYQKVQLQRLKNRL